MARRENDFYPTPQRGTEVLIEYLPEIIERGLVIEPCAGDGAISDVIKNHCRVITLDIDNTRKVDHVADARKLDVYDLLRKRAGDRQFALDYTTRDFTVATNPPFNVALPIIQNFWKFGHPCAFLLRLSILEPTEIRGDWLEENPPGNVLVLPRISFTGDGKTDSVTCAWMTWNFRNNYGVRVISKSKFYKR